jgi:hypothetical protein
MAIRAPVPATTKETAMNIATHTVDLTGTGPVEVTVADYGSGQPFLLLHGGAGPQSVTGFAEKLAAAHGVRVLDASSDLAPETSVRIIKPGIRVEL